MSDNHIDYALAANSEPVTYSSWEQSERRLVVSAPRTDAIDWHGFADCLPRLGSLLWLHRVVGDGIFPRARLLPQGVLLLDHPALIALADCKSVTAHSAVTSHGPREWLEFSDAQALCLARLYLLPDTDYLAWDAMLAQCNIARTLQPPPARWHAHAAFMRGAFARLRSPWRAQAVHLPVLRLPCLQVLGLRAPATLSELGSKIATAIAGDEQAPLQVFPL
jgi:hypothetical protein